MTTFWGVPWSDAVTAIVTLISAPVAVVGIFQAGGAVRAQRASNDLQTALSLWERIDTHWRTYRTASDEGEKLFEFGQLTGYYELACSLFRDNVLTTKAARTLEEHLSEVLPAMRADESFSRLFDALVSNPATFENIRWFCQSRPPLAPVPSGNNADAIKASVEFGRTRPELAAE